MLVVAGLLFLYTDVWMGGVDFFPDLFGYILLFIAVFRGWQYQKIYSSRMMMLSIAAGALAVINGAERTSYLISITLLLLTAIVQFFLVRSIYRSHKRLSGKAEKNEQDQLMETALILILICEICSPILNLIPILSYILVGLEFLVGILITVKMWQLLHFTQSQHS